MSGDDHHERWYYDANALEWESTYAEMIDRKHPKTIVVSHLSIGEAYGNSLRKDNQDGGTRTDAFENLMRKMRDYNVDVVDNDGSTKILAKIKEHFPELGPTDSLHLATAMSEGCCMFMTSDPDLLGLPQEKLQQLLKECGHTRLNIKAPKKRS